MTLRVTQKPGISLPVTYTEPTQPTGLVVVGTTDSTITLRCNASLPTDATYVEFYRWYLDGVPTEETTDPSITLTGLTENTYYVVGVSAVSSKRVESEQSSVIALTGESPSDIAEPPTVPSNLTNGTISYNAVSFSWTGSVSVDEYPVTGYRVYRDGGPPGSTDKTYWIDEGTVAGTTYLYQVEAVTAGGAVSPRASISITTPTTTQLAFGPIIPPTGYRASSPFPTWQIPVTGGVGTKVVTLLSGTMYPGGSILQDGTVPGVNLTSGAQGTWNFRARVTDDGIGAAVDSDTITVTIDYPLLGATVSAVPSAVVGADYSGQCYITPTGGTGSYSVSLRSGTYLPLGVSLTPDSPVAGIWELTGTPSDGAGQTHTPILDVTSGSQSYALPLSIFVQPTIVDLPLLISYPSFSPLTEGGAFSPVDPTVTNAVGALTFSYTGVLPGDMSLNASTGRLSCSGGDLTGATPGVTYAPRITVSDDATTPPKTASVRLSIPVAPTPTPTMSISVGSFPANMEAGDTVSVAATASGFSGSVTWEYSPLPSGFSGVVSGTGFNTFTFTASPIGQSAAGTTTQVSLTARETGSATNFKTVSVVITVDPLATAFVAPFLKAALPAVTLAGGTNEVESYSTATYVDAGSASDLVVDIAVAGQYPLPAGVSVRMNGTGIGGSFEIVNSGVLNPSVDITGIEYDLGLTYDDPTLSPPVGPADDEADWQSRSTGAGVIFFDDFRGYANTAALLAASTTGYNQTSPGYDGSQFMVALDTTSGITAGKCLKISTFDLAGQQGGGWGRNFSTTAINSFYIQFAIWMDEAALFWVNLNGDPNKKILNIESLGSGQIALTNPNNLGFPGAFVNGGTATRRKISTPYGNDWFNHSGIDTGASASTVSEYLRRYGPSRYIFNALRDYAYKASGSGSSNYVNRRGFQVPEPDALVSGSIPFVMNGWTVLEAKVVNDFATDSNDIFKLYAAPYGEAPTKIIDNNPGGAGTMEGNVLGNTRTTIYRQFEALNYPTGRSPEPGYRPTQVQKYDQFIASTSWIPFPGHLTETEPS